jgi:hypothetical protein
VVIINKNDKLKLDKAIDEFNKISQNIADSIVAQVDKEYPDASTTEKENMSASIMSALLNEVDDAGSWAVSWKAEDKRRQ